ncbi:stress response protein nst1-like [Durio zibethinus]|uniref:Stress response protein nst1-like n=1 Tax=Durio zibethinus TaxID=66656 RepID=A0A6P5ZG72_DURZI|nr:stress response protein nst1-like [Durio zibethinus]
MSRCYPYPPPGYVKNGIRDEALIESIKIQREEEKARKERKKEKRDRKEKEREKKERDKARDSGEIQSKKHGRKRHKDERSQEDKKGDHQKRRENEADSFEKSTITEEHGQAVGSQNSSDSTLNSNKRQKLSLPPDSGHNPGSIIRIRLPSQRHKDPEVLPSKEQSCSTSGRIDDAFVQGMHEHAPRPGRELEEHPYSTASIRRPELTIKLSKEKLCSSSGASESLAHNAEASLPSNLCSSCSPTLALELKNLVEDWVVPTLQTERTSFGEEDWLFQKKQNLSSGIKSSNEGNLGLSQINSPTWPHACYLPEADVYALPFTIPF